MGWGTVPAWPLPALLALARRVQDEGTMRFIKYVSAQAPGSRWDVSAVYSFVDDEDEGEGEGEGAAGGPQGTPAGGVLAAVAE